MQTTSPASLNLALSEALSRNLPDTAMKAGFNSGVLEDYRPDELAGVSVAGLVRVLGEFWSFGEAAGQAGLRIRLTKAQGDGGFRADLLEIVQPDAPYLVDSVMGELGDLGVQIIAMFHPVVQSPSGPLSMIQVWLAPVSDDVQARLLDNVRAALADTHAAIDDAAALKALLAETISALPPESPAEDVRFLQWLQAGWFVLLGARTYDYPRNPDGDYAAEEPVFDPTASLGVLRDPARSVLRRTSEPAVLSARLRNRLERTDAVVVAKSNLRSRVHRHAYMDYIGVRRTGADGTPSGEVRFVGLFTAGAYDQPARDTPLLRGKIAYVLAAAGFDAGSHNALRLANILETYPRDELFQIAPNDLLTSALDILHLYDRPKVKLFVRRDPFDRFVSVLFYAPRERYDARLRERVGEFLAKAFRGRVSAYYPRYSDDALARVHFIIGTTPGDTAHPDLAELEAQATNAARSWSDDFDTAVRASALVTPVAWEGAFPAGYRDRYDGAEAMADVLEIEALTTHQAVGVRAFRTGADSALQFRLKLYRRGDEPLHLSRVLPILQDMGLSALMEDGFVVTPRSANGGRDAVRIHDFILEDTRGDKLSFEAIKRPFEAAFTAVWSGQFESDGFNRLVLELGASLRQAALVRALARYRQQSGLDPSPLAQQAAVAAHPDVVRLILALFASRFDPATDNSREQRIAAGLEITGAIDQALQAVESLDEDRVLRRIAALVEAITRTNYYQPGPGGTEKPYISFKIASRTLTDLPAPKPYREIFVSGPNVEGVHLRFGPVARGGLRWSDRRDDFRTEVLGLVKAQQVKNAVIVPVGSKGGFFPKQLPRGGPPEAIRAEAISAYKTFLSGLLDLTDNRAVDGTVVQPLGVVAYDGEDPYLVVAADKGTATFSDIANGVAADYGFWLGDAFASGGSAGYDHKVMGITARGAWESVKRHFRELGKDIQRDPCERDRGRRYVR